MRRDAWFFFPFVPPSLRHCRVYNMKIYSQTLHTAAAKYDESIERAFNTRELLSNVEQGAEEEVGTMENATTLLKVAFSLDVRSFIDIPGVRCWNNKCLGDCFLSTVFLCTAFTIYRHPLHPENCFGKLLKPVLLLVVTLRQSGDFISFSQWQEFRVPRYRWCFSYSLERKHDMKCLNIVNGCVFEFQLCGRNFTHVLLIIIKETVDNYGRDEKVGLRGGEISYK